MTKQPPAQLKQTYLKQTQLKQTQPMRILVGLARCTSKPMFGRSSKPIASIATESKSIAKQASTYGLCIYC
jgi:hypothetical protein